MIKYEIQKVSIQKKTTKTTENINTMALSSRVLQVTKKGY